VNKTRNFLAAAIVLILLGVFGCANDSDGGIGEGVFGGEREGEREIEQTYTVKIEKSGAEKGDTVDVSHNKGAKGAKVTINYTLADTAKHNMLEFEGVSSAIDTVDSAEDGTRTYIINDADAKNGIITINAIFTHNAIAFTENKSRITKTYGDPAFTNAVASGDSRSNVTYSSSDTNVADVDSEGRVTIKKAGSTTITAVVQEDAGSAIITAFVQENTQAEYTLTVNPKLITITGLAAPNKVYNGTTAVTVNKTNAKIYGIIDGDDVTIDTSNAVFADKNIGTAKIINGISLTGADVGNYTVLEQPRVTANITVKTVYIQNLKVIDKVYDGTATATVDKTNMVINGKIDGDDVTAEGTAAFLEGAGNPYDKENPGYNVRPGVDKSVAFSDWTLKGSDARNYNLSGQPGYGKANIIGLGLKDSPLFARQTTTIKASVYPVQDVVNWKSSNTGVVTVSSDGKVTAVTSSGSAVITASTADGVYTAKCTVKIIPEIDMVLIPAGSFYMGANGGGTLHKVTLTKKYYMGKFPVTQQQWEAIMGKTITEQQSFGNDSYLDDRGRGDYYPIYFTTWYESLAFCNKMSLIEGLDPVYSVGGSTDPNDWGTVPNTSTIAASWNNILVMDISKNGYRLPTEAEWEYACSGDYPYKAIQTNPKPFGIGDGTKMIDGMANFNSNKAYDLAKGGAYDDPNGKSLGRTTEMGSFPPNNYGLYDMHGNVNEWCWDRYGSSYYSSSPENDPTGPDSGTPRVIRGGNYTTNGNSVLTASRNSHDSYTRYTSGNIGFRVVRKAD
jgi:formylglycine-generating enzyme required for sulfatase activity